MNRQFPLFTLTCLFVWITHPSFFSSLSSPPPPPLSQFGISQYRNVFESCFLIFFSAYPWWTLWESPAKRSDCILGIQFVPPPPHTPRVWEWPHLLLHTSPACALSFCESIAIAPVARTGLVAATSLSRSPHVSLVTEISLFLLLTVSQTHSYFPPQLPFPCSPHPHLQLPRFSLLIINASQPGRWVCSPCEVWWHCLETFLVVRRRGGR